MVAEGTPALDQIAAQGQADIASTFDESEATIQELAALIGAGAGATQEVTEDVDGEALRIAAAMEESASAEHLLSLTSSAARAEAVAAQDLDKGSIRRQAKMVDLEFESMEEQVKDQLAAARAAAAAAAAQARQRRSAIAAQRNAALAELNQEKYAAMRLNPHEAGEATVLSYLSKNGSGLDYNRQQLIFSTVSNAISTQVRSNQVSAWTRDQGIRLSPTELKLVRGALGAYSAGMKHQQDKDKAPPFRSRETR
jgi:hypothetical protein